MTSLKGKGVFPETHPLALGVSGRTVNAAGRHYLGKADVIFAIGASLSRGPGSQIPSGPTLIHSTIDEFPINKDYRSDHIIIGDAKLVLKQCMAEVRRQVGEQGRQANTSLHEEIARRKADWLESWMPLLNSSEVPINP